jgi:catechol 2,3-dioxygenase-like lactoylglutathione lyase family enzyme
MESGPRLSLIILAVRDVPRSVEFYTSVFGWPRTVDELAYVEFQMMGGQRLGLYAEESFARNTNAPALLASGQMVSPTELYFEAAQLEPLILRLTRAGARQLDPLAIRPWGDEAAYFADPDGHVIVVARSRA